MSSLRPALFTVVAGAALCTGLAACGMKGALALPEKSGNVVIRDKQAGATQTDGTGQPTSAEPEKLPPPELPRSNSGLSR